MSKASFNRRRKWSDYGDISIVTKVVRSKKQYCRAQSKTMLKREITAQL
jgi:hypothetical protein